VELGSRPRPGNDPEKDHLGHHVQGLHVRASKEEPQYLIESDTTDHLAMHKGSALKRLKGKS